MRRSIMPDGLEKRLTDREFVDLLAYCRRKSDRRAAEPIERGKLQSPELGGRARRGRSGRYWTRTSDLWYVRPTL